MEDFILNNVDAYGPIAVFLLLMLTGIGVPLGEDLIVIPAGAFVGHGQIGLWPTMVAAYLGVVVSDMIWFGLSYRYGTRLLHKRVFKRLLHPRRLLEAKHQMERRGAWMIVMARFIPGSRTTAITVAGILHMPFWKFAVATSACVLATVPIQIGIGYLSTQVMGVRDTAGLIRLIFGLMLLALAAMLGANVWRQHVQRRQRAPRAKAAWLRRFKIPRRRSLKRRGDGTTKGRTVRAAE